MNKKIVTYRSIQKTAGKYAELKKGTLNYLGNIDLQEYFIVRYDMFDSGPDNEWKTQVNLSKVEHDFR